jgi:hypothetical protein
VLLKRFKFIFLAMACSLLTSPSQAHHSFAATFGKDIISVDGVVDEYKFSNPHVTIYFDVTDEKGVKTRWMTEGLAATVMRRRGWTKTSIGKGDFIRVTGNSSRNGSPMVSAENIEFIDPLSGKVVGTPGGDVVNSDETSLTPMQLADGRPNVTGAWRRTAAGRPSDPSGAPLNAAGKVLQDKFDPINDPQVQCEPPGLVRQAAATPHPVRLTQYDDRVVIAYEEYGSVRTVYFGEESADLTANKTLTALGHSKARYDGQALVIETTHLLGNLTGTNGNELSDQTTTVERYYRNADEKGVSSLTMDMVITDPGHLTKPWKLSWTKSYLDEYEFIAVDCQPPLSD